MKIINIIITALLLVNTNISFSYAAEDYGYYLITNPQKRVIFNSDRKYLNFTDRLEKAEPCSQGNSLICVKNKNLLFTVPVHSQLQEKTFIPGTNLFIEKISWLKTDEKPSQLIQLNYVEADGYEWQFFYNTVWGLQYFTLSRLNEDTLVYMSLNPQGYGNSQF